MIKYWAMQVIMQVMQVIAGETLVNPGDKQLKFGTRFVFFSLPQIV